MPYTRTDAPRITITADTFGVGVELPHSREAEMALLGSMILDPHVTPDVQAIVRSPSDFYSEVHATIYAAMLDVYERRSSGDLVQVYEVLHGRGVIEDVGGSDYLLTLGHSVPSSANAVHYAGIVADHAKRRQLIESCGAVAHLAVHDGEDVPALVSRAETMLFAATDDPRTGPISVAAQVQETMHRVLDREDVGITGMATGFAVIDKMTSGFHPGQFILLGGRPSQGKTSCGMLIARYVSRTLPVAVYSLEMAKDALLHRMVCAEAGVDILRYRSNMLDLDERRSLMAAAGALSDCQLWIDDQAGITSLQLCARARRMARQHGVKLIVIDYLQLLAADRRYENQQVTVSNISRQLKALARELKAPVLCLSQLNRQSENRQEFRPRLSDLRDSGALEQDADVVMLIHREEHYHKGDVEWEDHNRDKLGMAEVIIAKQRDGPTGSVMLRFDEKWAGFRDWDGVAAPQGPYIEEDLPT